jgi:hypothetical protein
VVPGNLVTGSFLLTSEPVPGGNLAELDQVHHIDGGDVVLPPSQVIPPVALHIHYFTWGKNGVSVIGSALISIRSGSKEPTADPSGSLS